MIFNYDLYRIQAEKRPGETTHRRLAARGKSVQSLPHDSTSLVGRGPSFRRQLVLLSRARATAPLQRSPRSCDRFDSTAAPGLWPPPTVRTTPLGDRFSLRPIPYNDHPSTYTYIYHLKTSTNINKLNNNNNVFFPNAHLSRRFFYA